MYSGEYDVCDVTLSVYPHRESLKNMPCHGGNRWDAWPRWEFEMSFSMCIKAVIRALLKDTAIYIFIISF
jgi:hypothetical protein